MPTDKYHHLKQSGVLNSLLFLERFAFYGLQTFAYSYLVSESVNLYGNDASELLLTFSSALLFARIFGGLIVDFLLKPKMAIIVSSALQIMGILLFMKETLGMFYLGMFVYIAGQCIFSPAVLKAIGGVYSDKRNKMDGAITLGLFTINLGAFLAPQAFNYLNLAETFKSGFISCITCFLIVIGLCFLIKKNKETTNEVPSGQEFATRTNEVILLSILGLFTYWLLEQLLVRSTGNFSVNGFRSPDESPFLTLVPTLIPIIGYLVFGIIWNRFTFSPLLKITIGFAAAAITVFVGILLLESNQHGNPKFTIAFLSLNFIGEILIVPVLLSFILQYAPQKLMATYSGIALSMYGFLSMFIGNKIYDDLSAGNHHLLFIISGTGFFLCALAVLIVFLLNRKKDLAQAHLDEF